MTFQAILIIIGVVIAVGGVSYFVGKWRAKKLIEAGKILGASEENDDEREDIIVKAGDKIKENEDVIKESEDAIARAQDILAEARDKVRKAREKVHNVHNDVASGK